MDLRPDLIRPGLYLSSVRTEVYREVLDDHGITHILQVSGNCLGVRLELDYHGLWPADLPDLPPQPQRYR